MKFSKTVMIEYDYERGVASIDGRPLVFRDPEALGEILDAVNTHFVGCQQREAVIASRLRRGVSATGEAAAVGADVCAFLAGGR